MNGDLDIGKVPEIFFVLSCSVDQGVCSKVRHRRIHHNTILPLEPSAVIQFLLVVEVFPETQPYNVG